MSEKATAPIERYRSKTLTDEALVATDDDEGVVVEEAPAATVNVAARLTAREAAAKQALRIGGYAGLAKFEREWDDTNDI